MIRATDIPEAIQWHEGMLLAPQHFQQLALRSETLLNYHIALAAPYHWGVRRFAIDQMLLGTGMLRVTELEAVMPDGLVVTHAPGPGGELQLDLMPFADAARASPMTVHLAVAARRASGSSSDTELARYDSVERAEIADENAHDSEVSIPRLVPRLVLVTTPAGEPKPPAKYASLPLGRLAYRDEVFVLTDFIPPTLAVELRSPLGKLCGDFARRLREKAVFLVDQLSAAVTPATQASSQETRAALRSIIAGLPELEAILNTGSMHPFVVYLALMRLIGEMSGLGGGTVPPIFTTYDHDDPRTAFAEAVLFLQKSLERVEESYQPVPFTVERDRFSLVMDPAWLTPKLIVGARGTATQAEAATAAWLEEALIGPGRGLMPLFEARVRGAERRRIAADGEYELLPRRGVVLFEVTLEAGSVSPGETLEIWNPGASQPQQRPAEVLLYVRMR